MELSIGDEVMIYADPLTKRTEEGNARVLKIKDLGNLWYCEVRFCNEPDAKYWRMVSKA